MQNVQLFKFLSLNWESNFVQKCKLDENIISAIVDISLIVESAEYNRFNFILSDIFF